MSIREIQVTITTDMRTTRVLAQSNGADLLIARLGPLTGAHRYALRALLESIALWHSERVRVVLYADDQFEWEASGLLDALGFGRESLHFEVEIVPCASAPRRAKHLGGLGSFARERRSLRSASSR